MSSPEGLALVEACEQEDPKALDQNCCRELQERGHEINEANTGYPNAPSGNLGGQDFFCDKIP